MHDEQRTTEKDTVLLQEESNNTSIENSTTEAQQESSSPAEQNNTQKHALKDNENQDNDNTEQENKSSISQENTTTNHGVEENNLEKDSSHSADKEDSVIEIDNKAIETNTIHNESLHTESIQESIPNTTAIQDSTKEDKIIEIPFLHTMHISTNTIERLRSIPEAEQYGKITKIVGLIAEAKGIQGSLGTLCYIYPSSLTEEPIFAEVVGFKEETLLLMPYSDMRGIMPGSLITVSNVNSSFPIGKALLGRTLDAFGNPIDMKGPLYTTESCVIYNAPPSPLSRPRIHEVVDTGIRSINALLTMGKGQRIGIMAGSGVGKSTLLGMMARYTDATINVIALVGERGREVMEFIEKDLGKEGMERSVVIVATSDQSALLRMRAAYAATAIAEYFRDLGNDVLLMMDSVTRFAMAGREIGLAIGEPPTTKGYTPSVFAQLPKLLERTGRSEKGSITGIYTVLVDGDDFNDPIADSVRSILDGHIVLTRELADAGHFPAIDIMRSVSRLRQDLVPEDIIEAGRSLLKYMALYKQKEDMISIGAYTIGTNPELDKAIAIQTEVNAFLTQGINTNISVTESFTALRKLMLFNTLETNNTPIQNNNAYS